MVSDTRSPTGLVPASYTHGDTAWREVKVMPTRGNWIVIRDWCQCALTWGLISVLLNRAKGDDRPD